MCFHTGAQNYLENRNAVRTGNGSGGEQCFSRHIRLAHRLTFCKTAGKWIRILSLFVNTEVISM
jgi:hypothetical protein